VFVMVPAGLAIPLVGGANGMIGEAPGRPPTRSAGRRAHDLTFVNDVTEGGARTTRRAFFAAASFGPETQAELIVSAALTL
jgi:hypothetical protein